MRSGIFGSVVLSIKNLRGCIFCTNSVDAGVGMVLNEGIMADIKGKRTHRLGGLKTIAAAGAVAAAGMTGAQQAEAAMIGLTLRGHYDGYWGSPVLADGMTIVTGSTVSQSYLIDTNTLTGTATEKISTGTNTYEFSSDNTVLSIIPRDILGQEIIINSTHPGDPNFNFGLVMLVKPEAPVLQSDLSNLQSFVDYVTVNPSAVNTAFFNTAVLVSHTGPYFQYDSVAIPEPASLGLLLGAGAALTMRRRASNMQVKGLRHTRLTMNV